MSGVVKGIKKAFKAIGNVVKKVFSNKIFRTVLMIGAAIFTGGAAAAAFGALGSGAGLGAAISAGVSGGLSTLGTAVGAVTGGIQSLLGIGTSTATTAATTAATEAAGAAAGEGIIAAGGDAMGAAAAEAAAPGAASWMAPDPGAMGLAGGEAGSAVSGLTQAAQPGSEFQLMSQPGSQWTPPGGVDAAQTFASNPPGGYGASIGAKGSSFNASSFGGLPNDSWASDTFSKVWNFLKPETADGYKMWGNVLMGVGQGAMAGRQAESQRAWQEKMTAVPDITKTFEPKPGYRWALMGSK